MMGIPRANSGQRRMQTAKVPAAILLIMVSACNAKVPLAAPISASPSTVLKLSWAKAKRTDRGVEVSGQIKQVHCCRYLHGHIHLEAKGLNGVNVASTDARWGDFNMRQLHSAWFNALLPVPRGSEVSAIEIEFRVD